MPENDSQASDFFLLNAPKV